MSHMMNSCIFPFVGLTIEGNENFDTILEEYLSFTDLNFSVPVIMTNFRMLNSNELCKTHCINGTDQVDSV